MNTHTENAQKPHKLTKNQALVYGVLQGAERPMSAYDILDGLREQGLRAPLQVYRALEKLLDSGLVHRLESENAFLACRHSGLSTPCGDHGGTAFAICDDCGQADELDVQDLKSVLNTALAESGFALSKTTLELHGLCKACAEQPSGGSS